MPGGRQFAMLSYSYEPEIRDFAITFHFARYCGVSFGASGPRPCEPSAVGDERVGGGSGSPGRGGGGRAPPSPCAGEYTPAKLGRSAVGGLAATAVGAMSAAAS